MSTEYVLEIKNITKLFPGARALDKMNFNLKPGEIHGLVGENGAGKSTLMKILSGVYQPDEGDIIIKGKKVHFENPAQSEKNGINIVYQELSVFPNLSASENIYVNHQPKNQLGLIDYKKVFKNVRELFDKYGLSDVNEKRNLMGLSVGRQQMIEIVRAVNMNSEIIIFDEPTSALTEKETNILFDIMRQLKSEGVSIIYISHRLEEIFQICDRVTVMRDGIFINTFEVSDITSDVLIKNMVGRDVAYSYGSGTTEIKEALLTIENLTLEPFFRNVSFTVHAGEVLGLAGLDGAGRTEVLECIFGSKKPTSGRILIKGKEIVVDSPGAAKKEGIAYITKERKTRGLFVSRSITDNMLSVNIDRFTNKGLAQDGKVVKETEKYRKIFEIKTPSINKIVTELSGGNQQKVLMSMWLSFELNYG